MRHLLLALLVLGLPAVASADRTFEYTLDDATPLGVRADGTAWYLIPDSAITSLHLGVGARFAQAEGRGTRLFVDVTEGLRFGRSYQGDPSVRGLIVIPRLGYTYDGPTVHLARVGVAVGTGQSWASITYAPHLVLGRSHGELAVGVRHGMLASFLSDMVTLELSHQMLFTASRAEHDIRGVASLNLLIVMYALAAAS